MILFLILKLLIYAQKKAVNYWAAKGEIVCGTYLRQEFHHRHEPLVYACLSFF
jgi:hypothetical protein